jgi:hypothetical protein
MSTRPARWRRSSASREPRPTRFPNSAHPTRPPPQLIHPHPKSPIQLIPTTISPTQLIPPDHLANSAKFVHSRPGYPQARSTRPGCRSLLVDWQGGTPPGSGGGWHRARERNRRSCRCRFGAVSTRGRCLQALADWVVLVWLFLSPAGFASGGSSPEGQVSGMVWSRGWVEGMVAIPSTFLRIITPARGGPVVLWAGFLRCGPPRSGVIRLRQVDGMATSPRGISGLAPGFFGWYWACLALRTDARLCRPLPIPPRLGKIVGRVSYRFPTAWVGAFTAFRLRRGSIEPS